MLAHLAFSASFLKRWKWAEKWPKHGKSWLNPLDVCKLWEDFRFHEYVGTWEYDRTCYGIWKWRYAIYLHWLPCEFDRVAIFLKHRFRQKNRVSGIVWLEVEVVFNELKGHPSLLVCMTYGSELHLTLCRSQHVLIFCIHSDLGPLKTLVLHQDAVFLFKDWILDKSIPGLLPLKNNRIFRQILCQLGRISFKFFALGSRGIFRFSKNDSR